MAPLASLTARFNAKMIDGAFTLAAALISMMVAFPMLSERVSQLYVLEPVVQPLPVLSPVLVIKFSLPLVIITLIQAYFLTVDGQSVGKKAVGIQIVRKRDGRNGGFVPNVLIRTLLNAILGVFPLYGLLDVLLIFTEDRRCLHDYLAGTVVVVGTGSPPRATLESLRPPPPR